MVDYDGMDEDRYFESLPEEKRTWAGRKHIITSFALNMGLGVLLMGPLLYSSIYLLQTRELRNQGLNLHERVCEDNPPRNQCSKSLLDCIHETNELLE